LQPSPVIATVAPPEPWTQVYRGGLPKDHWARVSLIRECHFSIENAAIKAISTGRMQRVLDAINALQQVPFTINKPVLEFIKQKSAPPVPDPSLPKHRQVEMQTRLEAWQQDIVLAEALCDRFYVPLNIDFRGRIYPIPHFAFTREDHVRALFLFADGAPIGEEGLLWLKAHVAARADGNSWSKVEKPSKLNRAGRIAWTEEHLGTLCKFGNAVLASDDPAKWKWVLPDDPWQFAAACVELTQAIDVGPSFVTRLPLNFDATCSGLQHLCLMTRAEEGRHVNLASSDEPDDFYQRVAYEVWRGNPALHDLMKNPFNRAIVKQPVMTYFYGSMPGGWSKSRGGRSLPYGMTAQICEVLENRQSTRYAKELATAIYRSIGAMAPKAAGVLHSLRRLSKLCAEHELPLRWTTPNGLPVINRYHDPIIKRIKVPVSGRSRFVNLAVGDKEGIAKAKAANAVTANFVHSADAAHLQLVAIATAKENIAIVSVHDCFASLAPHAARLNEIIRDQLIRMHKRYNWLNEIWESARRDLPKSVKLPPRPEIGDLDIEGVRDNQHAFN
jgi:DNA-directed RNA polymerase, mitochondrial